MKRGFLKSDKILSSTKNVEAARQDNRPTLQSEKAGELC